MWFEKNEWCEGFILVVFMVLIKLTFLPFALAKHTIRTAALAPSLVWTMCTRTSLMMSVMSFNCWYVVAFLQTYEKCHEDM